MTIIDIQLFDRAHARLSSETLTVHQGQLPDVIRICREKNRNCGPYVLLAREGNVTRILWRSNQS